MNMKHAALVTLIALLSAGTLGCPTDMPASTTAPDTTEAPPVAVHTDTNTDNGSTDTTTDSGGTITDPGNNTTTVTNTDPGTTITPSDTTTTDPNDGATDPGSTEPPSSSISGTFAGTLSWANSQFLAGGDPSPSGSDDAPISVAFDEDGVITAVLFRGFVDAPDGMAAVQQVGDKVTITQCKGDGMPDWQDCASVQFVTATSTQTIRVLSTHYTSSGATVEIRVRHELTQGQLVESGVGIQTIDISVSGDQLTYESTMTYEVALGTSGGVSIDVGEISTTSGTLQRE